MFQLKPVQNSFKSYCRPSRIEQFYHNKDNVAQRSKRCLSIWTKSTNLLIIVRSEFNLVVHNVILIFTVFRCLHKSSHMLTTNNFMLFERVLNEIMIF